MIDKKKLKDVMKKQDLKQEEPTDPSMTLDVKNEDVEAQIDLYLKEKTGENLNALIELMRTRRVLVPANLNDEKKPVPCLINSPKNGMFLPIYTSKKEIPESPKSAAVINMPFLATNNMVFQQDEKVSGIVINPFTQNLIFKRALVEKIEEVEKKRKEGAQPKKMQLTQEQYLLFERKQFEFGFMPKRFFAQGKQMMDDLCEKKEEYMDQFFEECYQQKRMYPYLPEDFSVMVMDLSDSLLIVRVDLPYAIWEFHPVSVYILHGMTKRRRADILRLNGPRIRENICLENSKKTGSMLTMERLRQREPSCSVCWILSGSRVKIKRKSVSGK
jgi:hypothetical protein